MTDLITHFFEDGTQEQYDAIVAQAHPADGSLPAGVHVTNQVSA
jgi:hypothetical protein